MSKVALVFPGQGSQSPGMLSALAALEPLVADTFAEASSVLGFDLWATVSQGTEAELAATEVTQPAMLAADVAVWRVWHKHGLPQPTALAGHSLGEFAALVAAEALSFPDAVKLVQRRAHCMQSAVPIGEGAMAAILGLSEEVVTAICREGSEGAVVSPANLNAPGQVVIAGAIDAVDRTVALCREAGAKRAVRLAVSVPSHCALMRPAAEQFRADIEAVSWSLPRVPVIHNVSAQPVQDLPALRQALIDQLHAPVQWQRSVSYMTELGVEAYYECGPGRVLSGLGRRIVKDAQWVALENPEHWPVAL